jgi:hypothetical protein
MTKDARIQVFEEKNREQRRYFKKTSLSHQTIVAEKDELISTLRSITLF